MIQYSQKLAHNASGVMLQCKEYLKITAKLS